MQSHRPPPPFGRTSPVSDTTKEWLIRVGRWPRRPGGDGPRETDCPCPRYACRGLRRSRGAQLGYTRILRAKECRPGRAQSGGYPTALGLYGGKRINIGQAVGVFFAALVPCYLGTVFPDLDIRLLGIGGHRDPLFHSSVSLFVLFLLVRRQVRFLHIRVAGYGVGLASHLWWDIVHYGDVQWMPGVLLTGCGSASTGYSAL